MGFYYSLMDWHHPDGARCATDEAARRRFVDYIHGLIRELMTNYGKIDVLWYDVSWPLNAAGWESEKMNKMVFELQPDIIVNNRNGCRRRFRHAGAAHPGRQGRAWETCMTMSRNLGHLAVSPLTSVELATALLTMSLIRTIAGMVPSAIGALLLYHYNVFNMGLPLLAFFVNLIVTGWAFGLGVSALVLRYGQGAESLAWVIIVAIAPFCGIYYPVSTLPVWLQHVSWALPPSHVFEGVRAVALGGAFPLHELAITVGLNLIYLAVGAGLFIWVNHVARVRGLFIGMGE